MAGLDTGDQQKGWSGNSWLETFLRTPPKPLSATAHLRWRILSSYPKGELHSLTITPLSAIAPCQLQRSLEDEFSTHLKDTGSVPIVSSGRKKRGEPLRGGQNRGAPTPHTPPSPSRMGPIENKGSLSPEVPQGEDNEVWISATP